MGIPDRERKEMERREDGSGGIFRTEAGLDIEQKTRKGGMNINNILCWKMMDIIESCSEAMRSEFHSFPCLMCVIDCICRCTRTTLPFCLCMNLPASKTEHILLHGLYI